MQFSLISKISSHFPFSNYFCGKRNQIWSELTVFISIFRMMCGNQCVVFTVWTIYALAALLTLTVIAMVAKLVLPHVTVKWVFFVFLAYKSEAFTQLSYHFITHVVCRPPPDLPLFPRWAVQTRALRAQPQSRGLSSTDPPPSRSLKRSSKIITVTSALWWATNHHPHTHTLTHTFTLLDSR